MLKQACLPDRQVQYKQYWAMVIGGKIFKDTNLLKKTIAVLFILFGAILILRD
jgi:hypothetical protein